MFSVLSMMFSLEGYQLNLEPTMATTIITSNNEPINNNNVEYIVCL